MGQSSGAALKSRWPSWAPVPNKPTVSVDVKQHFNIVGTLLFGSGYSERGGKMTDTRKQKAEKASEMPIKHSLFVGNMQVG